MPISWFLCRFCLKSDFFFSVTVLRSPQHVSNSSLCSKGFQIPLVFPALCLLRGSLSKQSIDFWTKSKYLNVLNLISVCCLCEQLTFFFWEGGKLSSRNFRNAMLLHSRQEVFGKLFSEFLKPAGLLKPADNQWRSRALISCNLTWSCCNHNWKREVSFQNEISLKLNLSTKFVAMKENLKHNLLLL